MNKAFTKEDDAAGLELPKPAPVSTFGKLSPIGARLARARLEALEAGPSRAEEEGELGRLRALLAGELLSGDGTRVTFGTEVKLRPERGKARTVVLVSPDEVGLVPNGISVTTPLARALLGASAGDQVEVEKKDGTELVEVLAVRAVD